NDITDLSDGRFHFVSVLIDCCHYIKIEEASPPDHFNSQYSHHALVTNNLFIDEWNYLRYVKLTWGPKGLDFSVAGDKGSPNGDLSICIRSVIPECTAARDGRIRQGDVILSVNGISFENISHKVAVETLTRFRGDITLKLCSP
uniref:PDZ domain-containing protein n=1 Tax=Amphimedon queenslandica TaxID=400682 RepID=A0A1X7TPT1_AMPQE